MPLPNHCIDCDKPAAIIENGVYLCGKCAMKEIERKKKEEEGRWRSLKED